MVSSNLVTMTVADYCNAYLRKEILIDTRYQRSRDVWPPQARSYLIETIVKGFPIPKLALHQLTDIKSKKTIKYVVDGQQRTNTIIDFFKNELRLTKSLEMEHLAGATLDSLPDLLQSQFLSYVLYFDQFEASTDADVREYFRRINSFTAPLNAEEKRHAQYQGTMKWFIHELAEKYGEALISLEALSSSSVIRMADTKFLAELVHGLIYGIRTTSQSSLDSMYREHDKEDDFHSEKLRLALDRSLETVMQWPDLRGTPLFRAHVFYSLILAVVRVQSHWETLASEALAPQNVHENAVANLLRLAGALENPDAEAYAGYRTFALASADRTNVKAQRQTRVDWIAKALVERSV